MSETTIQPSGKAEVRNRTGWENRVANRPQVQRAEPKEMASRDPQRQAPVEQPKAGADAGGGSDTPTKQDAQPNNQGSQDRAPVNSSLEPKQMEDRARRSGEFTAIKREEPPAEGNPTPTSANTSATGTEAQTEGEEQVTDQEPTAQDSEESLRLDMDENGMIVLDEDNPNFVIRRKSGAVTPLKQAVHEGFVRSRHDREVTEFKNQKKQAESALQTLERIKQTPYGRIYAAMIEQGADPAEAHRVAEASLPVQERTQPQTQSQHDPEPKLPPNTYEGDPEHDRWKLDHARWEMRQEINQAVSQTVKPLAETIQQREQRERERERQIEQQNEIAQHNLAAVERLADMLFEEYGVDYNSLTPEEQDQTLAAWRTGGIKAKFDLTDKQVTSTRKITDAELNAIHAIAFPNGFTLGTVEAPQKQPATQAPQKGTRPAYSRSVYIQKREAPPTRPVTDLSVQAHNAIPKNPPTPPLAPNGQTRYGAGPQVSDRRRARNSGASWEGRVKGA